jgi:thiol:disulfide interchange protein
MFLKLNQAFSIKSLLLVFFLILSTCSDNFAQSVDTVSFDDLEFTEITEEVVSDSSNDTIKSTDSLVSSPAIIDNPSVSNEGSMSLWAIFIAGILGGFAAFIMPCIFPMLPLTVSYFTKKSKSKAKSISQALIYGLSIILIYVVLGLLVFLTSFSLFC